MTCTIKTGFVCPLDNSYMKRNSTDTDLRCSDRAQDGVFDGPFFNISPYKNETRKTD
jgi:hypothetical protein